MNPAVSASIPSVNITDNTRIDHRMIECRIEDRFFIPATALYSDARQFAVPTFFSFLPHRVKVFCRNLLPVVVFSPLHVNEGNPHFHGNSLIITGGKLRKEPEVLSFYLTGIPDDGSLGYSLLICITGHILSFPLPCVRNVSTPEAIIIQRLAENRIEINRIVSISAAVSPASPFRRTFHPAADSMLVFHLYVLECRSPAHTARQVNLNAGVRMRRISEAEHTAMSRSRGFHFNAIICQGRTIISGRSLFRSFVICRTVSRHGSVFFSRNQPKLAGGRHGHEISQISIPAYPTHLSEGKAFYGTVLVAVTGTVITARYCLRTDLDHAEGICCSGKSFS